LGVVIIRLRRANPVHETILMVTALVRFGQQKKEIITKLLLSFKLDDATTD
jgi:hypothetical protein